MRVAGLGFRKGVSAESLAEVLGLVGPFDALATVETKAQEAGLQILIHRLGVPLHAVPQGALRAEQRPGSDLSLAVHGTGSVAESAALAAAGPGARLVVMRVKGRDGQSVAAVAESK